jgi:hypothetical protein
MRLFYAKIETWVAGRYVRQLRNIIRNMPDVPAVLIWYSCPYQHLYILDFWFMRLVSTCSRCRSLPGPMRPLSARTARLATANADGIARMFPLKFEDLLSSAISNR